MKEKLLILGGTEFVGRQLVEKLLTEPSIEIYLFNRGKTNPGLFPDVKLIKGDRETDDIKKLKNQKWDYVVDFSSYYPKSLKKTLEQINKDVKKYIYISTISVFSLKNYDSTFEINEDYEKVKYTDEELIDKTLKTYGKKKAACEEVLNKTEWLNKTILRPSIMYGKYDPTDRFYYWIKKIKENKKTLLPDNGEHRLSLTFADDLVQIILSNIRGGLNNDIYNCSTHPPMKVKEMMETVKGALNSNCAFVNISSQELKEEGIRLPLAFGGNLMIDNSKLKDSKEVNFTSFNDSINSVINYYKKENWKDCSIKIDEGLERSLLNRKQ